MQTSVKSSDAKIAILCNRYAFEVSPVIKNLCSYLYDHGFGTVDLITDKLYRDEKFSQRGANIVNFAGSRSGRLFSLSPDVRIVRDVVKEMKTRLFATFVSSRIHDYSLVFAADFPALDLLNRASFDLSRCIFLSLEGVDYLRRENPDRVRDMLSRCAFCVVQNEARSRDIESHLDTELRTEYLPVSMRPGNRHPGADTGDLGVIYSGYFAPWAALLQFLRAYETDRCYEMSSLLLHGHLMGTESYFDEVAAVARRIPNSRIDTSYYDDEHHLELMACHDVGICLYDTSIQTTNFTHIEVASGKLAGYLWAGLAVLTNIDVPLTQDKPFIRIRDFETDNIKGLLQHVKANRAEFRARAYETAHMEYNFDRYMEQVATRIEQILVEGKQ